MPFKAEVIADSSGTWADNGFIFETRKEAEDYVRDLAWRWTAVRQHRVVETSDKATYRWLAVGIAEPLV